MTVNFFGIRDYLNYTRTESYNGAMPTERFVALFCTINESTFGLSDFDIVMTENTDIPRMEVTYDVTIDQTNQRKIMSPRVLNFANNTNTNFNSVVVIDGGDYDDNINFHLQREAAISSSGTPMILTDSSQAIRFGHRLITPGGLSTRAAAEKSIGTIPVNVALPLPLLNFGRFTLAIYQQNALINVGPSLAATVQLGKIIINI